MHIHISLKQRFSIPVLVPPRSAYFACLSLLTHLIQIISLLEVRSMCNGCIPVRAVCKPHSPDLKMRRSLVERLPPAPASRVQDPLVVRTRGGYTCMNCVLIDMLPTQGPLLPTQGPLLPTQGPLLPTQGPLLPTQGPLLPTQGPLRPTP